MFRVSKCAATQLKSVALRYRHALVRVGAPASGSSRRYGSGVTHATGEPRASAKHLRDDKLTRVEALLFVAREPLSSRKIAQLACLADGTEARTLIRRLDCLYDNQASAFRVEQVAGGYQILTRRKFGGWLRRLHQTSVETRLSAPAMETLAIVAYRQPVLRAEIESIRGVQCGELLRQLMERDLIRIAGRSEELGRPFLYSTTRRFLHWLGLRSLDDLPRGATLRRKDAHEDEASNEIRPAARRDNELTPRIDLNEEPEVKKVPTRESDLSEANEREPWLLAAAATTLLSPYAAAEDEDVEDEDEDLDDEDDDYDDEDDDYEDEDEDLDDDDLEDEEWEEVDDEDDWEDEDDEDWEDEDEDEEEDEDWEDE